jgi:hypothetical protein
MRHSRRRFWRLSLGPALCFWLASTAWMPASLYGSVVPESESSWFRNVQRFSGSAHGTISCETCHEDKAFQDPPHPNTEDTRFLKGEAKRMYDYSRCASCHRTSYQRYLQGKHAEALKKEVEGVKELEEAVSQENRRAPTCGDCHSAHYDKAHLSRVDTGRAMTGVCGSCHQPQTASYLKNYHGKAAVNLGNPKAAYCTDCHGTHECVSLKEKEAALNACRRCHTDARENFAGVVIHPTTADLTDQDENKRARVAVIRVVTTLMFVLVTLVVGFFYGHSFLWILREIHKKLRRRPW